MGGTLVSVATLASHSALQILHGAKKEGLETVLIVKRDRYKFYSQFSFIDNFIIVESWKEVTSKQVESELRRLDSIVVPHGSFVEYVGPERLMKFDVPMFGTRKLLEWEASQKRKMELLKRANIPTPKEYKPEEVEGLVIVKLAGAKGGRGYFLARGREELLERLKDLKEEYVIQEYVIGVPAYYHFFYSPVLKRLEITGMDIRYESNVDGLKRLPPKYLDVEPTFTVVGNIPMVLRESLLIKVFEYGMRFVETVERLVGQRMIGPFCLESIIKDDGSVVVFEFSGRIVAGTNLYVNGSPYSWFYWDEPMSVGRRIAREIRMALDKGIIEEVTT